LISEVKAPNKILDLGCGCGFTSVEIANEFENAVVYGVDVSTDAINFARRNFQNKRLIFEKKSISCKFNNIDMYDIIFAIEFYPFSRSNDQFFQNSFIEYLSKHLENSGSLIIYQALTLNFYKNLKSIIRKNKYLNIKALFIPNLKVLDFLKVRPVAIAFCLILNLFFKRNFINIFVEIQNK
jgi:16S rRNA G1207 methylase RsmC